MQHDELYSRILRRRGELKAPPVKAETGPGSGLKGSGHYGLGVWHWLSRASCSRLDRFRVAGLCGVDGSRKELPARGRYHAAHLESMCIHV